MITVINEITNKQYTFPSNELAIDFIKTHNFTAYTVKNDTESFTFIGGKLFLAETPQFSKIGDIVYKKQQ
jgi:hypothetical protein